MVYGGKEILLSSITWIFALKAVMWTAGLGAGFGAFAISWISFQSRWARRTAEEMARKRWRMLCVGNVRRGGMEMVCVQFFLADAQAHNRGLEEIFLVLHRRDFEKMRMHDSFGFLFTPDGTHGPSNEPGSYLCIAKSAV